MRPYLAVIRDAFRAAFASRILWVALVAIYLFLFAVAPIGYREVFTTTIRWFDIANGTRMKALLAQGIANPDPTPAGNLAKALPEELQQNLNKVAQGEEVRIRLDLLADSLSKLLDRNDWFDAQVWKNTLRLRELRELEQIDAPNLSSEQARRLARLRIEAALPGVFESRAPRSLALTYAGFDFPAVFQLDPTQFKLLLNHFVLRIIIDWLLGFIMIFLGILVTASIIPDMLQPGSLHLLLSKPISRPLLFLAKFVGGCAFVLLCVAQLIIGLWLISGFRLGIWNSRLLLCIPVCVFLFAVFYSVSAVAGLRWRSSILSIGVANAFGALCLLIGMAGGISDGFVRGPDRIEAMTIVGDSIIAATKGADLRRWDEESKKWADLFPDENGGGDRILAPISLSPTTIATARVRGGRMNVFGSGATPLLLLQRDEQWKPAPSIELPTSTTQLFSPRPGELLALNSSELMMATESAMNEVQGGRRPGNVDDKNDQTQNGNDTSRDPSSKRQGWLPSLMKLMGGETAGFRSIIPQGTSVTAPRSLAFSDDGAMLTLYSTGRLARLHRDESSDATQAGMVPWKVAVKREVDPESKTVFVRHLGEAIVLLRAGKPPLFFDGDLQPLDVKMKANIDFEKFKPAVAIRCAEADSIAWVSAEGGLFIMKMTADQAEITQVAAVSDVDSIAWDATRKWLWCSHHIDHITALSLDGLSIQRQLSPRVEDWRLVDKFVLTPLRTLTPQTGELGETIATLVSGESTFDFPIAGEEIPTERYNFWRPLITCAGFIVVMLTVGCVYFSRADF